MKYRSVRHARASAEPRRPSRAWIWVHQEPYPSYGRLGRTARCRPIRQVDRSYKFAGMSFIAIGILFLSKCILDLLAGAPPSSGVEILAWRAAQEPTLAITNEVLFFAAGFLIPAVIGLYRCLARVAGTAAAVGCGLIAVVIPTVLALAIIQAPCLSDLWTARRYARGRRVRPRRPLRRATRRRGTVRARHLVAQRRDATWRLRARPCERRSWVALHLRRSVARCSVPSGAETRTGPVDT